MRIPSGVTDQVIYFVAIDSADSSSRKPGLSGFTAYRSRNGGAAAQMTTPTITEIDATNMPGVYTLLLDEDMALDAGDDSQEMAFHIAATGMLPVTRTIELYRPKITLGNVLAVSAGGIASADMASIDGSVAAATALGQSTDTMLTFTVTGSPTATVVAASGLSALTGADDVLIGRTVIFTSGTGKYEAARIRDYDDATGTMTLTTLAVVPIAGDTGVII